MVKHTQTIRWQQPTNCLSMFEHFVGLALKGLTHFVSMFCSILDEIIKCFKALKYRKPVIEGFFSVQKKMFQQ